MASISFIKDYTTTLQTYVDDCETYIEKYIKIWERFCHYSFENPEIYYTVFYSKLNSSYKNIIEEYYDIYPEDLPKESKYLKDMLRHQNMYDRGRALLTPCVDEGSIRNEDIEALNDIHILLYKGILSRVINKEIDLSIDDIKQMAMSYIVKTLYLYIDSKYVDVFDNDYKEISLCIYKLNTYT